MDLKTVEANTILRAVVGSTAHGVNLDQGGDRDEMGVCVEPLEAFAGFDGFEQYVYRTAAEREGRQDAPSQPGDLDLTIYSLRKFLRLCMSGNPTVILLLFVKDCLINNALGQKLQALAPHIVSKRAGGAFLGYMQAQRQRLIGERGQKKVNRPELEEKYGYDTKYAMHMLRLGMQGVELLSTGSLTLPMAPKDREFLLGVRTGSIDLNEVLNTAGQLEVQVKDLMDNSPLPRRPNQALVEDWMIARYWEMWKAQRVLIDRSGNPYEREAQ